MNQALTNSLIATVLWPFVYLAFRQYPITCAFFCALELVDV